MTDQPTEPIPIQPSGNVGTPIHDRAREWAERYWPNPTPGEPAEHADVTTAAAAAYAQGWNDHEEQLTSVGLADRSKPTAADPGKQSAIAPPRPSDAKGSVTPPALPLAPANAGIRYIGDTDQERLVTAAMEAHRQSGQPVRVEHHRFGSKFTITIGDTGATIQ